MIWDISNDRVVTRIPHHTDYERWMSRLSVEQINAIRNEIVHLISGDEIVTAGWLPGADWSGTPFHAIYEIACRSDFEQAGKCFGLMVWTTLMEHEAHWGFGRYELNNLPISSMTYFKVQPKI